MKYLLNFCLIVIVLVIFSGLLSSCNSLSPANSSSSGGGGSSSASSGTTIFTTVTYPTTAYQLNFSASGVLQSSNVITYRVAQSQGWSDIHTYLVVTYDSNGNFVSYWMQNPNYNFGYTVTNPGSDGILYNSDDIVSYYELWGTGSGEGIGYKSSSTLNLNFKTVDPAILCWNDALLNAKYYTNIGQNTIRRIYCTNIGPDNVWDTSDDVVSSKSTIFDGGATGIAWYREYDNPPSFFFWSSYSREYVYDKAGSGGNWFASDAHINFMVSNTFGSLPYFYTNQTTYSNINTGSGSPSYVKFGYSTITWSASSLVSATITNN